MSIDTATVAKIARLARIAVPESDHARLAGELSKIMGFVEQLGEVDTQGVEPMTSVANVTQRLRDDVVTDGGIQAKIIANAPESAQGYFVVPKIVE